MLPISADSSRPPHERSRAIERLNLTAGMWLLFAGCASSAPYDTIEASGGVVGTANAGAGSAPTSRAGDSSSTASGAGGSAASGAGGAPGGGSGAGGSSSTGGCPDGPPPAGLKVRLNAALGVSLQGDALSEWADQSGQNNPPATQGEGGHRPTMKAAAVNGKPVVHFDGEDDYLALPFPVNGRDHMTIAAISRTWAFQNGSPNKDCDFDQDGLTDIGRELNCSGTDQSLITWPEGNAQFAHTGIFYGIGQTEVTFRFGTGKDYLNFKTPFVLLNPPADAFVWSAAVMNGPSRRFYLNGAIPTGRLDYRDAATAMLETTTLRDEYDRAQPDAPSAVDRTEPVAHIGRGRFAPATSFWAGDLAELLIYDTALSDSDLSALGTYVKCTYGIQ